MSPDDTIEVGLLLCDQLDPDVAEVAGGYPHLYAQAYAPAGIEFRIYDVREGAFPESTDECTRWMTSGSRHSAYEDLAWIDRTRSFIAELAAEHRPHVGICFGHQLAAQALGGAVERAAGWGIGVQHFDLDAGAPWIDDDATGFDILMTHQDQVTLLPDDAEVLASAPYCPVGAYRVDDHLFCVQGHPEFVAPLSAYLAEKRRERIGDDVVDAALASLDRPLDHARVVDWIGRFYRLDRA